jgi:hypothetical protein
MDAQFTRQNKNEILLRACAAIKIFQLSGAAQCERSSDFVRACHTKSQQNTPRVREARRHRLASAAAGFVIASITMRRIRAAREN